MIPQYESDLNDYEELLQHQLDEIKHFRNRGSKASARRIRTLMSTVTAAGKALRKSMLEARV